MASQVEDSSTFLKSIFGPSTGGLSLFSSSSSFRRTSTASAVADSAVRSPLPDDSKEEGNQKKRKHEKHTFDKPTEEMNSGKISRAIECDTSQHSKESERKRKLEKSNSVLVLKERKVVAADSLEWKKQNGFKPEKRRERGDDDSLEQDTPVKRRKVDHWKMSNEHQRSEPHPEDIGEKFDASIQVGLNIDNTNGSTKRKKEENIEGIYEKRLKNGKTPVHVIADLSVEKDVKQTNEETSKKRKRDIVDHQPAKNKAVDQHVSGTNTGTFDDQEKLRRTLFVGNLPLKVKKKAVIKEFSQYGPIDSVRLRSIPLLDSKIPSRKGAIIKGEVNEAINSQHAYIVFQEASHAKAALSHNMKEFNGNHLRVDAAYAPHKATNGNSISYDHTRTIFVGNLPFDVKDEELYQIFTPEMNVEAIRVVRDPQTSLSKGIAFVLFKTKESARCILSSKKKTKLRDRLLRITRVLQNLKQTTSPKHVKLENNDDETRLQRKRAKTASYEGIRAKKEVKLKRNSSMSVKTQEGSKGAMGSKRKRAEKRQRGTSRSKKIRRT